MGKPVTIQDIITGALTTDDIWSYMTDTFGRENIAMFPFGQDCMEALRDLRGTADEMKKLGNSIIQSTNNAIGHVSGLPAPFNSLGVIQQEAPRFDALCAVFALQVKTAQKALNRWGYSNA